MADELNSAESGHFTGKIAVATNDGKRVTGHIGRCRSFMIFELNGEKVIKAFPMNGLNTIQAKKS